MSLIKRTNVKEFALQRCKKLRPSWGCTRVSAKTLDDFEFALGIIIRHCVQEFPDNIDKVSSIEFDLAKKLLNMSLVKKRLLGGFKDRFSWLDINEIRDDCVKYIVGLFVNHIDKAIHSHPSVGKTLMIR